MRAATRLKARLSNLGALHCRPSSWRTGLRAASMLGLWVGGCALLAFAYNPEQDQVGGMPVKTMWPGGQVTWSLNPTVGSNVHTSSSTDIPNALSAVFSAWTSTPLTAQIGVVNNLSVTQGPDSTLTDPDMSDCVNVVSFSPTSAVNFPTGTIAFTDIVTSFGTPPTIYNCSTPPSSRTCNLPSCLIDTDIVFNPKEQFSTAQPTPSGDFDVQTIATHEVGHLLGLDHSGVAAAVMYPFGDTGASGSTSLSTDDAAGIAFVYPSSKFSTATGTLSGTVTQNGKGIFAAHVVAIDNSTGNAIMDGLTDTSGKYNLVGLPPGSYQVLVLPLAPDLNSGIYTLDDFGGWTCGFNENAPPCATSGIPLTNPTNYTGTFH